MYYVRNYSVFIYIYIASYQTGIRIGTTLKLEIINSKSSQLVILPVSSKYFSVLGKLEKKGALSIYRMC